VAIRQFLPSETLALREIMRTLMGFARLNPFYNFLPGCSGG
jgi:hypothetical protein